MAAKDLSARRLRELLHYDPESGVFTWRVTRTGSAKAGTVAGTLVRSEDGYECLSIHVDGVPQKAHRLAWLYMTGDWPLGLLDHRDTNGLNNRFVNLRLADAALNARNRSRPQRNNSSGYLGVSKSGNRWRALIRVNGIRVSLGSYATREEAAAAYRAGKERLHPEVSI